VPEIIFFAGKTYNGAFQAQLPFANFGVKKVSVPSKNPKKCPIICFAPDEKNTIPALSELEVHKYFYVPKRDRRDLIYRIFKRCTGRAIQPDRTRLLGYLINTLGRMVSLYNYQGRNAEGLKSCRNYLTQHSTQCARLCPLSLPPMWIARTF
jgi:hypothetical protein